MEMTEKKYKSLSRAAKKICLALLSAPDDEIVSRSIADFWLKHDTFKGNSSESTWFNALVKNLCLMKLRQARQRGEELSLESVPEGVHPPSNDLSSYSMIELLADLPPKERLHVELRLEGADKQEIADALGCSFTYEMVLWRNLKEKLKRRLIKR